MEGGGIGGNGKRRGRETLEINFPELICKNQLPQPHTKALFIGMSCITNIKTKQS